MGFADYCWKREGGMDITVRIRHNASMIEKQSLLAMQSQIEKDRTDLPHILSDTADQDLLAQIQHGLDCQSKIIDAALQHLDFPLHLPDSTPTR